MPSSQIKIGVITNVYGHSMAELKRAATAAGALLEIVPFSHIPLTGLADSELVQTLLSFDAVYYRTGMRDTALAEVAFLLSKHNIPLINSGHPDYQPHKKIQQALIADRHAIPQPKSLVLKEPSYELASAILGSTFVGKPNVGSQGRRVEKISTPKDLDDYLAGQRSDDYLFQELVADADEYRVYTLGDKSVASYKKQSGRNDFRANLHAGGSLLPTEPEREERLFAFAANIARVFNADISGIDILCRDDQLLFLEINWQPGWAQVKELTGIDFAKETIDHVLECAQQRQV